MNLRYQWLVFVRVCFTLSMKVLQDQTTRPWNSQSLSVVWNCYHTKVKMFWNVFKNCLKLLLHLWAVFLCCTEWHAVLFYSLKMFFIQSVYDDMVKHLIIKINFDFISIEKGNFIYRFLWFLVLVTIATVFNFHIYYRCCQTKTTV